MHRARRQVSEGISESIGGGGGDGGGGTGVPQ